MKKGLCLAAVLLALALFGCAPKEAQMVLEKAQLDEREEKIAELLGADADQLLYDFTLDDSVKSLQVNTYQLVDGAWEMVSGGAQAFSDPKGRLALGFVNLAQGLRVALQSEAGTDASKYETNQQEDYSGMARATSSRCERTEIAYGQEIPLVLQVLTTQNAVSTYETDMFFEPQRYEAAGYEHVYAVTITFFQEEVKEVKSSHAQP